MEFFNSEVALGILGANPKPSFVCTENTEHGFEQCEFIEGICKVQSDTRIQYALVTYCNFVTRKHRLGTHRSKPLTAGQRGWHQKFQQFVKLPLSKGFLASSDASMAKSMRDASSGKRTENKILPTVVPLSSPGAIIHTSITVKDLVVPGKGRLWI